MEELKQSTQNLKEHVGDYVSTYMQIAKAKVTQSASTAASGAAIGIASLVLGVFFPAFRFLRRCLLARVCYG